ncbi:MAG: peptide ABC transporter substrate-binding protein [Dehalococcoidia bacterium]|nr:peptide ABC transporter substrate-binding protein [Dehalococcoidia bacterium]MYA51898.1 peptide ABC transporter substrate-binding protein [Dehalococcoidia bacterium]
MSNRTLGLMMGAVALLIVAVAVVFVLVLAGGDGDDDGDTPASTTDRSDRDAGDDEGDARDSGGDTSDSGRSSGGICGENRLVTFGDDPATVFDPIQVGDASTAEYTAEIFGGLVSLNLDLEVVPDIAESWEISDDGRVYTFFLRDDVVFHNGRRVTADDVKYSLERAADPANFSPTVLDYLGDIVGVRDKFNGRADDISGVQVIDEYTLRIELDEPVSYFLQQLTYTVAYVVDQDQIEDDPNNWTRRPNGTGPFRVKTFRPLEEIVLIPNDRYHLGPPRVDEIVFSLSGGSLSTRFQNDEIHIAIVPAPELAGVLSGESELAEFYRPSPQLSISYLGMNLNEPPFDDPLVRQAFAHATNRQAVNEVLYFDAFIVADGILPPTLPGYNESISTYPYDPERAAELLAQSRYAGNMPRIVLTFSGTGGDPPDALQAYQQQWRDALGVEVEVEAIEWAAYLRELRRGTLQMYATGWIADYADPENFVGKLFSSDSRINHSNYENARVDALLEEAATLQDPEARYRLYHEAEQIIIDDAPIIPTFWAIRHYLVRECVQNWVDPGTIVPKYRFIEIDTSGE